MKFHYRPSSHDLIIKRKAFMPRRAIKSHPALLFFLLGEMQQGDQVSSFPKDLVRKMETIIRHLLLGGHVNSGLLRQLESYHAVLTMAELASAVSRSHARVTYSTPLMAFMLMLVAEVTYMWEDINAADAIKRVERLSEFDLEYYKGGVRSRSEFKEKYGFKVDVKDMYIWDPLATRWS